MVDAAAVVAAYWAAEQARDWDRLGSLVAEDVVYEAPQSRERVRGRAAYLRFCSEGFPGDWSLAVRRIVADERTAATVIEFRDESGAQADLCFFDLDDTGLIVGIEDYWPEPYDPPPGRAHLVERC